MGDSPLQRSSYRDAIGYDNEAKRYELESQFQDWKSKVSALQSQMRDNQLDLKQSNRRYQQVQAAGGQGTYGTPELGRSIGKLRTEIEGSKSGLQATPTYTGYGLQGSKELQQESSGISSGIQAKEKQIYDIQNRKDPFSGKVLPMSREDNNTITDLNRQIQKDKDALNLADTKYGEQSEFEQKQLAAANAWNADLTQKEQDFISSLLNEAEPETPSIRGMKVEKTPQQINLERDQMINSTMQKPAPTKTNAKVDMYLAKKPLAGFNSSNLKAAKGRVQGAVLGGSNSNQLTV